MNCFLVKVKTTNSSRDTTYDYSGAFTKCSDGQLYILADKYSDIEKIIASDSILSIKLLGHGYIVDEQT